MKLKQSETLAPANEPWTLIRDLELQEKQEGVDVDMSGWHVPIINGACHQCLAGSVMSRRLGVDTDDGAVPSTFPEDVTARLCALDDLRVGEIGLAYRKLKLEFPSSIPVRVTIPGYHLFGPPAYHLFGPPAFKEAMLKLADQLEAAQPKPTKP